MRMTPLDVQSHQFASRFRGFDPDEVEAFLRIVSEDYEGLVRETESQADRIRRLESHALDDRILALAGMLGTALIGQWWGPLLEDRENGNRSGRL